MGRLPGFDYKRPFFYMVTLKKARGACLAKPFSAIESGVVVANDVTRAFESVIRHFHEMWYCIEPIRHFVIMPDHIHLIIKMRNIEKRVSLAVVVRQLMKRLDAAAEQPLQNSGAALQGGKPAAIVAAEQPLQDREQAAQGKVLQGALRAPVFEFDWHDWIVKKDGQLATFTRYIRENPRRAWLRRQNRQYFSQVRRVVFAGREWFAYGNAALLELPVVEPFRCSRKWTKDGPEWRGAVAAASRIGPGGAGVGTFMSPCEKECGNAIYKAGGTLIVLAPEGFGERWHPPRNKEALCAKGKMLFLSLYPASVARPDNVTLYRRCHEMGDLILNCNKEKRL
jgi:REP element-mobilizing transposase RayT